MSRKMDTDDLPNVYDRTRPCRRPDVRSYALGAETLLYDPATDTAHAINTSAMAVWDLCDGTRTVAEITAELAGWLEHDAGHLAADVQNGIAQFHALGLLSAA